MIIETQSLSKRFARHAALTDVALQVPRGSIYALVGANGAGKTTLIKILMNILQPSSGRATVLSSDSRRLGTRELARIGYVSENQQLPMALSVDAYLDYLRPLYPTWDRELERSLRTQFGLPGTRRIRALSHGMRMKVALVGALAHCPALLVMDEPFAGLDPLVRDELMDGVLRQAEEMTVLMSSHELSEIEGAVTHVGFLEASRLTFQEPLTALAQRMREIHVQCEGEPAIPALPGTWIDARVEGSVLRFVDTQHDPAVLRARIEQLGLAVRAVEARPMGLRAIFTALARTQRRAEEAA